MGFLLELIAKAFRDEEVVGHTLVGQQVLSIGPDGCIKMILRRSQRGGELRLVISCAMARDGAVFTGGIRIEGNRGRKRLGNRRHAKVLDGVCAVVGR